MRMITETDDSGNIIRQYAELEPVSNGVWFRDVGVAIVKMNWVSAVVEDDKIIYHNRSLYNSDDFKRKAQEQQSLLSSLIFDFSKFRNMMKLYSKIYSDGAKQ